MPRNYDVWREFRVTALHCSYVTVAGFVEALQRIGKRRSLSEAEAQQLKALTELRDALLFHLPVWDEPAIMHQGREDLWRLFQRADELTRHGVSAADLADA